MDIVFILPPLVFCLIEMNSFHLEMLLSPPADGLLLISDTCLPECPVGLLQAEGNSPLQVIFIIPSQVNDIYINRTHIVVLIMHDVLCYC